MKKHYGPRLKMLHCCTDRAITDSLAEMELTAAQGHIMGFLAHSAEPPCPRDIEEKFHLSHPTVSGILSRLEQKGFLELRPDPSDRRCKRIWVLPKGMECHDLMHNTILSNEERMVQNFTPQEREQFLNLLTRAIENMGHSPCQHKSKEETPK